MKAAIYARKSTDEGTDKAAEDKSVEQQKRSTLDFIASKGWTVDPEHVYEDDGISGGEWQKRPALLKLMEAANAREFDVLVMRDFNRLGRDAVRNPVFIEKLTEAGIEIWFSDTGEQVRFETPADKGMVGMRSTFAEQHRYECSKLGHGKSKDLWSQGRNPGGRVFGYDNLWVNPDGTRELAPPGKNKPFKATQTFWQINEAEAAVVRTIFRIYADGHGIGTVARTLNAFHGKPYEPKPIKEKHRKRKHPEKARAIRNSGGVGRARAHYEMLNQKYFGGGTPPTPAKGTGSWSVASVYAILHRERYVGLIPFGGSRKVFLNGTKVRQTMDGKKRLQTQFHEIKELRIIPPELWAAAQERYAASRKTYLRDTGGKLWGNPGSAAESKYLLTSIGRCGCCGASITVRGGRTGHGDNRRPLYYYGCSWHYTRGPNVCGNDATGRVHDTDEALLTAIEEQVLTPDRWAYTAERALQFIEEQRRERPDRPREIEGELKKLHRELDRFMVLIAGGQAPDRVLAEVAEREKRAKVLEHELGQWQGVPADELDPRRLRRAVTAQIERFKDLLRGDVPLARQALRKLLVPKSLRLLPEATEGRRRTFRFEAQTRIGPLLDPRYIEGASPRGPTRYITDLTLPLSGRVG